MVTLNSTLKRSLIGATIALTIVSSALANDRGHKPGHHKHDPDAKIAHLTQALDLSENQAAQIKQIMLTNAESRTGRREQRKIINDLIDANLVNEAAESAATFARQNVYNKADFKQQLNSVLTTEQAEELAVLKAKRHERHMRKSAETSDS